MAPVTLDIRPPASAGTAPRVSVIMPLAPRDVAPDRLIAMLPGDFEVILARGGTRASSMNRAARAARGAHLWFIHADTALDAAAIGALCARLDSGRPALWYFDLRFDGGFALRITELGVLFRSRVLGLPFGDQAFCLPAEAFRLTGGFDEAAPYGEDHLLVWAMGRIGYPVLPIGRSVTTSARKYKEHGWLRTTSTHLALTVRQALPEWLARRRGHARRADTRPEDQPRHR